MTYRELVYMALDALKIHSDDSKFTEDHVIFLLNKYRAYALHQKYSKTLEGVNNRNYQTIQVSIKYLESNRLEGEYYARSDKSIPNILTITLPEVWRDEFRNEECVYTTDKRLKYTGNNRFLKKTIYCSVSNENKLWIKSTNVDVKTISYVFLYAVFSDPIEAYNFVTSTEDILDLDFPLEDVLVPSVLELVLKDLTNGIYKPSDTTNDAQDALSDLAGFLRRNMKSQFQKQIDE